MSEHEQIVSEAISLLRGMTKAEVAMVLRHLPGVEAKTLRSGTCRMVFKIRPPEQERKKAPRRRRYRSGADGIPADCRL